MARWRTARWGGLARGPGGAAGSSPTRWPCAPFLPPAAASPLVDLRSSAPPFEPTTGDPWDDAIAYLQDVADGAGVGDRRAIARGRRHQAVRTPPRRRRVAAGAHHCGAGRRLAGRPSTGGGRSRRRQSRRTSSAWMPWRYLRPTASGTTLADGHAVVLVGYGRHAAFPGGGYVIVRNCWRGWGDDGDGYMPFTFVRTYATELRAYRFPGSRRAAGGGGPSRADRPAAGHLGCRRSCPAGQAHRDRCAHRSPRPLRRSSEPRSRTCSSPTT